LSANISWDLGPATLTSITAYRDLDYRATYDLDGLSLHLLDSLQSNDANQFSQEILLNGTSFGDRLNWTLGGLYFDEDALQIDRSVAFAALVALQGSTGSLAFQNGLNKSYGLFGQGTFKVTDALSITGGLRYSKDDRTFIANSFDVGLGTGAQNCVFTAANGLATLPIFSAPCTLRQKSSDDQWSYTAAVDYQIDSDKLVYFRTGRGYRAAGFNPRILAPETLGSFGAEIVTDYEIGLKADWLDNTLRTNFAFFHSTGKDIQSTRSAISATTNASLTFTENRGTRKIDGFEMDLLARPANWFFFNLGFSYLDAKLDDPLTPDVTFVPLVPKYAVTVGATLEHSFSTVTAKLRGDVSFRDKMFDSQDAVLRDAAGKIFFRGQYDDLTLLNARFSLRHEPTGIEAALFGRNLGNVSYNARQASIPALGFQFNTLGEPRVIGLELKVPFGPR
jgi:iron complex outermembrane recepter protein